VNQEITAEEYASRLRVWCRKDRAYDQLPSKRRDRWILYHAICRGIGAEEVLTEPGINAWLRDWLAGVGRSLQKIDIALIRRELIEKGFLQRDPAGREYRRSDRHLREFGFEPEVENLDAGAIVENTATGDR
jgi:hypothetical protein